MNDIIKFKYLKCLIICIFLMTLIACNQQGNQEHSVFSKYNVVDSIEVNFEDIVKIHSLARIENKFICINMLDRTSIILFDDNGAILSSYNKKGKGPKEILRAQELFVYGDTIYVLDSDNSKLLIFNLINNKINYANELKIDSNPVSLVKIDKDRILISHLGANNNLSLYNNAKMTNNYSINIKKNINNLKDFLSTAILIVKFPKSDNIVIGGVTTGDLTFCKFNDNDSLVVLKNAKIKHKINKKSEVKTNNEKKKTDVYLNGIKVVQCIKNYCYISTHDLSLIHSFEVYDENGNYKGLSKLLNVKKEISYFIFSNNSDTLWFMKKDIDNTIYIAKKKGGNYE